MLIDQLRPALKGRTRALDESITVHLAALEALVAQHQAGGGNDPEAQLIIGYLRWLRFASLPGEAGRRELTKWTAAYENVARLGRFNAPPEVMDYLEHLQRTPNPPAILKKMWRDSGTSRLADVGRALMMSRNDLRHAARRDAVPLMVSTAECHLRRFAGAGHRDDLDQSIVLASELITLPLSPPLLLSAKLTLGRALVFTAEMDARPADVEGAFRLIEQAIKDDPGTLPPALGADLVNALGFIATAAVEQTGDPAYLDRAIDLLPRLRIPAADREQFRSFLLVERFKAGRGELSVIDEAIAVAEQGINDVGHLGPETAARWYEVALAYYERFSVTHNVADLTAAIRNARTSVRRRSEVSLVRERLAFWLAERHQLTDDREDLMAAADLLRDLYRDHDLSPDSEVEAVEIMLTVDAFDETALTETVLALRPAIRNPGRRGVFFAFMLSRVLVKLAVKTGDPQHLDEAVGSARLVLSRVREVAEPEVSPGWTTNALVEALTRRGRPDDREEVVRLLEKTDGTGTEGSAMKVRRRIRLAGALLARSESGHNPDDRSAALELLRRAAEDPAATISDRTDAAYLWATESADAGNYRSASDGYRIAVELIVDQARQPLRQPERDAMARRWGLAAQDGAACAILAGRPEAALALLEQGRSLRIGPTLDLRDELQWLRENRPGLADDMAPILGAIEAYRQGMQGEIPRDFMQAYVPMHAFMKKRVNPILDSLAKDFTSAESLFAGAQARAEEMGREVLSEDTRHEIVTRLSEFEARLRQLEPGRPWQVPVDVTSLSAAVSGGHGVVINVSEYGCHALIVGSGRLTDVSLPALTADDVDSQAREVTLAVLAMEIGDRSAAARQRARTAMVEAQAWMWETIAEPVLDALDYRARMEERWPRIWWSPTGALAGLPLHAAGKIGPHGRGPNVLDRVVSSYTTTLGMLHRARHASGRGREKPRLLAVAVPEIADAAPLHLVDREFAALAPWLTDGDPPLTGDQVTINSVTDRLPRHDWVHFACHGTPPIPGQPAQLYLSNGTLTVNRLAWLRPVQAELAYLSACHTASGSTRTDDLSDHLVAAFQGAGYQHVIGSLWGATDTLATGVATDFYGELARSGPHADRAAHALHHAVRRQRDAYPGKPALWAPFVHYGP